MAKEIECFGAKGDLLFKKDGTMTASSAVLTSVDGEFRSTDVGKTIVVNGAGASGAPLITTISSRQSATQVTLALAASTTVSSPPAIYYYGTNDTPAFQSAIDQTVAAGGGRVTLGNRGYLLVDDLILPGRVIADEQVVIVEFVGEVGPIRSNWNNLSGTIGSEHDVELPIVGQTIVQKAKASGKIIYVNWTTPGSGNPSGIQVLFQNISFRVPVNTSAQGLDLQHVYSCRIIDVTVEPSDHQSNLPPPISGPVGIYLPRIGNGAQVVLRRVGIAGFDVGMRESEHADLGDLWFYRCRYALVTQPANLAPLWGRIQIVWCPHGVVTSDINPGPPEYVSDGGLVVFEDAIDGHWASLVYHVNDPSSNLRGSFTYQRTKAFVGIISGPLQVTGGANLLLKEYGKSTKVTSVASSAAPAPNAETDDVYILTALAANATFAAPTGLPFSTQQLVIRIRDNGTARTLAWNAIYRAIAALPATTVANKTTYLTFRYNSDDVKWDCISNVTEP